jgi:hypothetical protein
MHAIIDNNVYESKHIFELVSYPDALHLTQRADLHQATHG